MKVFMTKKDTMLREPILRLAVISCIHVYSKRNEILALAHLIL